MFKRGITSVFAVIAITGLVALGGCGGGDDESSSTPDSNATATVTTSSLNKAQFVRKANAICSTDLNGLLGLIRKAISKGQGLQQVEKALDPIVEDWITEIEALGAPEGEEAEVEDFLRQLQADAQKSSGKPSTNIEQLAKNFKKSGEAARDVGLEACALG